MTREENKQYYLTWLKKFFTEEDIDKILEQYPINTYVVQPLNRKEGYLIEDYFGRKVLILYLSANKTPKSNKTGWVGINSEGKIEIVPTDYIKGEKLSDNDIKDFIFNYYSKENNKGDFCNKGEALIKKALLKLKFDKNFIIKHEYEVLELVNFLDLWKQPPRYDYAVLDKETEKPLMFLEFDGKLHYTAISREDKKDFWKRLRRDNVKNAYAFYSLIPLIRIPYGILEEYDNINKVIEIISSYLKTIDRATPKILDK